MIQPQDDVTEEDGHDHEFVSVCCGVPEHPEIPSMCGNCHELIIFECSCGRERSETDD